MFGILFAASICKKNPSYIHMVFNDGSRPMHIAAESFVDGLKKCKMLSLTDLGTRNNKNLTPLDCIYKAMGFLCGCDGWFS
jgi:hypothetical protein